jgi:hypothetical protein
LMGFSRWSWEAKWWIFLHSVFAFLNIAY